MKKLKSWFKRVMNRNNEQVKGKECHSIDAMQHNNREIRGRIEKMKATLNGEDKWMLTLKERH